LSSLALRGSRTRDTSPPPPQVATSSATFNHSLTCLPSAVQKIPDTQQAQPTNGFRTRSNTLLVPAVSLMVLPQQRGQHPNKIVPPSRLREANGTYAVRVLKTMSCGAGPARQICDQLEGSLDLSGLAIFWVSMLAHCLHSATTITQPSSSRLQLARPHLNPSLEPTSTPQHQPIHRFLDPLANRCVRPPPIHPLFGSVLDALAGSCSAGGRCWMECTRKRTKGLLVAFAAESRRGGRCWMEGTRKPAAT
jgi:hypothetical protein